MARLSGGRLGIELENKLELTDVGGPGLVFAETTRFCVLKSWRHSGDSSTACAYPGCCRSHALEPSHSPTPHGPHPGPEQETSMNTRNGNHFTTNWIDALEHEARMLLKEFMWRS